MEADRPRKDEIAQRHRPVVLRAVHVATATRAADLPSANLPEVAFAGRSNVGKSSLLNALCGRRDLARTSSTPGKTRLLQLFELEIRPAGEASLRLRLCDLPGYGWAKVSQSERERWRPMVTSYLEQRTSLTALVALVDVRRGVADADALLFELCAGARITPIVVATKLDQLSKSERIPALDRLRAQLPGGTTSPPPRPIGTSAVEGAGLADLWAALLKRIRPAVAVLLAAAALAFAPGDARPAGRTGAAEPAPLGGAELVDLILAVVGKDEVITLGDLHVETRLRLLDVVPEGELGAEARRSLKYPRPLTMPLGRGELRSAFEAVWRQRLLWLEARRHKRTAAPATDVDVAFARLWAKEPADEWERFARLYGGTAAVVRALVARDEAIGAFVDDRITARIKIARDDAIAFYESRRADFPGAFTEVEAGVYASLLAAERSRRLGEWLGALAKKHGVRLIADVP